jgi:hypothetical protein
MPYDLFFSYRRHDLDRAKPLLLVALTACGVRVFRDETAMVGPMGDDELWRAIERPTQLVGCEIESGLVDLLMQDVRR